MILLYFLCLAELAIAQIGTVLASKLQGQNLTLFKSYLDQYPDFGQQLSQGNVTILAPSNNAMLAFNKTATVNQTTPGALLALFQYHVVVGRIPTISQVGAPFIGPGDEPQFLPTLLDNASYANITGGQRVEHLYTNSSVFRSSIHLDSAIITTDIAYVEQGGLPGLINVIDRVLTMPGTTVGALKAGNFTIGYNIATKLPQETSKQNAPSKYSTVFIPNDQVPDLSGYSTDYLVHLTDYHLFPNYLVYSPDFNNNSIMTSQQGGNVTMRIVNGDTYLNDAKIIATDYLVYNGVMHILDKPLNFSLPDAIPAPLLALSGGNTSTALSNPPSQAKSTLPIGAKVGIGLVVAITVFGIIGIAIYFYRQRTGRGRKESLNELSGEYKVEKVHEMASPDDTVAELNDKSQIMSELPAEMWKPAELDGGVETASLKELDTNERLDVISSNARSRRKSMEIRMQRKTEQDRIRTDNERENTQSPFDKQERETLRNNMDGGVYRPSDHAPNLVSPEGFGVPRVMDTNREIAPDTPIDETSLERIMTAEPEGGAYVRPSISISEEPRSPISPMSSLREGALSPSPNQLAPNQSPTSTTPTTGPVHDANWGRDGNMSSAPVNTGVTEAAIKYSGK